MWFAGGRKKIYAKLSHTNKSGNKPDLQKDNGSKPSRAQEKGKIVTVFCTFGAFFIKKMYICVLFCLLIRDRKTQGSTSPFPKDMHFFAAFFVSSFVVFVPLSENPTYPTLFLTRAGATSATNRMPQVCGPVENIPCRMVADEQPQFISH